MFRFLVSRYRRLVVLDLAALATVQLAAIVVYDLGISGLRSATVDGLVFALSIGLFTAVPFGLAFDATRRHGMIVPGTKARAGAYLGITLNAIVGGVSALLGVLQALLRNQLLGEADSVTSTSLVILLPSLVFVIWLGGAMAWMGNRVALLGARAKP